MKRFVVGLLWLAGILVGRAADLPALNFGAVAEKQLWIPMRDGVRLFTAVYVPKDDAQSYPFLLNRTPYSCAPYGVDKYPDNLRTPASYVKSGYIFVFQDVRGRWMSEGEFVNMRPINPNKGPKDTDESSDTFDTIDWLVKNVKGHNGKAGQWGISYPGFYTVCGMIDAHPALKASSPQAPVTDWFIGDDWHHNGALFLPHVFNFMPRFGKPRPEPTTKYPYLPFEHGMADGYKFFLELGPIKNADAKFFKGEIGFWKEVFAHPNYDDWWKARNVRQHIKNINPAVLTVGGWFDAENLFGALETFKNAESHNWPKRNHLVMGPWVHGGWNRQDGDKLGDVTFNAKTGEFYRDKIEFPFFEFHLKGKGENKHPKAWVFETGTNRWRRFDTWPPPEAKPRVNPLVLATVTEAQGNELTVSVGLDAGLAKGVMLTVNRDTNDREPLGSLRITAVFPKHAQGLFTPVRDGRPRVGDTVRAAAGTGFYLGEQSTLTTDTKGAGTFDEFISDPAKPVPFISKTVINMAKEYMTADQRFAAARPDVLVYQTPPLTEDTTLAGPIEVELFVSTTGTDADWVVNVIDVYPDDFPDPDPNPTEVKMGGYQQLVRGEPFRGKFRNSFEKPEPFEPGKLSKIQFTMPDVLHTFRPGHRIMVQVQSTWFPLVDRNPQTFCDIYTADESAFKKQTHRVYRAADHPSRISVRVIK